MSLLLCYISHSPTGLLAEAEKPPEEEGAPTGGKPAGLPAAPKPGSYVPPSLRNRWVDGYAWLSAMFRVLTCSTLVLQQAVGGWVRGCGGERAWTGRITWTGLDRRRESLMGRIYHFGQPEG